MIFISDSGSLPRPRNGTDGIIAHRYRFADTGIARYLNDLNISVPRFYVKIANIFDVIRGIFVNIVSAVIFDINNPMFHGYYLRIFVDADRKLG